MFKPFALFALASCSVASAADWDASHVTPYSCAALSPAPQVSHVDSALIAPWRALADQRDVDAIWVASVQALAQAPLPVLSIEERVRMQHQLLEVAERLEHAHAENPAWSGWRVAQDRVIARIRAIAPTAGELALLGESSHPAVTSILGPASGITERATRTCAEGRSFHVRRFGGLLAFRPLRAGTTRALVAQLVAIDDKGKPHITPLVDGMELRMGDDVTAPACIVQAGDDGVLRPAAHAEIREHGFVQRRGDGVGCVSCHNKPNTMRARDLTALELPAIDDARDGQVESLAGSLWTRLSDRQ